MQAENTTFQHDTIGPLKKKRGLTPVNLSDDAWYNKGNGLYTFRNYKEAIRCYDKPLEINSGLGQAWNNKGAALKNS